MSPKEKQIAIAESCGWKWDSKNSHKKHWVRPNGEKIFVHFWCGKGEFSTLSYLPDYLNDLNAMHEAEKVLTEEQNDKYLTILSWSIVEQAEMAHRATAAQRAEAFLKTLNLWTNV